MPVFPEVGSRITPPGEITPCSSACRSISNATRSLTLPAGFQPSSLPKICARRPRSAANRPNRTNGVRAHQLFCGLINCHTVSSSVNHLHSHWVHSST